MLSSLSFICPNSSQAEERKISDSPADLYICWPCVGLQARRCQKHQGYKRWARSEGNLFKLERCIIHWFIRRRDNSLHLCPLFHPRRPQRNTSGPSIHPLTANYWLWVFHCNNNKWFSNLVSGNFSFTPLHHPTLAVSVSIPPLPHLLLAALHRLWLLNKTVEYERTSLVRRLGEQQCARSDVGFTSVDTTPACQTRLWGMWEMSLLQSSIQ